MLEIVDADLCRFTETYRTKMAGDFQSALVRCFDCRAQFIARYVHVGFKRSRALIGPVVNQLARIIRPRERVHHWCERANAFEIRRGYMNLWSNHAAAVDQFLDFQIKVRLDAAGSANRRDAEREIEAWKTRAHIRIHRRRAAHGKEHVVVHAYQSGQDCVAFEIENLRASRYVRSCARPNRLNLLVGDNDGLIFERRGAHAIDHAYVGQSDYRRFCADELLTIGLRTLREAHDESCEQ